MTNSGGKWSIVNDQWSILIALLLLLLPACGKEGPPLPPSILIPEPVKDLKAIQSGYTLTLTWTNPAKNIDRSAATKLSHVQIRITGSLLASVSVSHLVKPQEMSFH